MRKLFIAIMVIIIFATLFAGCGNNNQNEPTGTMAPTMTVKPTTTMVPTMTNGPADTMGPGGTTTIQPTVSPNTLPSP